MSRLWRRGKRSKMIPLFVLVQREVMMRSSAIASRVPSRRTCGEGQLSLITCWASGWRRVKDIFVALCPELMKCNTAKYVYCSTKLCARRQGRAHASGSLVRMIDARWHTAEQ